MPSTYRTVFFAVGAQQRLVDHLVPDAHLLVPAGDGAALPIRQGARLNAKLRSGVGAPFFTLLCAFQPALGVLAGLDAVLAPARQQVRHSGHGAPPQPGDLGTAEQNNVGFPAVV